MAEGKRLFQATGTAWPKAEEHGPAQHVGETASITATVTNS